MTVWLEVALRPVASPHILHHDRVPSGDGFPHQLRIERLGPSVGSTVDQHGEAALSRGAENIRPQHDPIAHGDGHAGIHPGRCLGGDRRSSRAEQQ
jgi:hypothetical protein